MVLDSHERGPVERFIFDGCEIPQPSLPSPAMVRPFDPSRDGQPGILACGPPLTVHAFFCSSDSNYCIAALSAHLWADPGPEFSVVGLFDLWLLVQVCSFQPAESFLVLPGAGATTSRLARRTRSRCLVRRPGTAPKLQRPVDINTTRFAPTIWAPSLGTPKPQKAAACQGLAELTAVMRHVTESHIVMPPHSPTSMNHQK